MAKVKFNHDEFRMLLAEREIPITHVEAALKANGVTVNIRDWASKGIAPSSHALFHLSKLLAVPMESLLIEQEEQVSEVRVGE